jgi:hypothetical protein
MRSIVGGHEGSQNPDRMSDGVPNHVLDWVLDEVSEEVSDGGMNRDFSLLHIDHALNPCKHQTKLN